PSSTAALSRALTMGFERVPSRMRGPHRSCRRGSIWQTKRVRHAACAARCREARVTTPVTVVDLFVYPVKSARGIAKTRARVTATGLECDRQWMLVDARGTFLSQRTHPQLTRIVPEITDDALVLHTSGVAALRVPLDIGGERVPVRVWKDACVGVDQGGAAHEWVSGVVGQAVRLVRVAPDMQRAANPEFAGATPAPLGFPDGYPLLVCNR